MKYLRSMRSALLVAVAVLSCGSAATHGIAQTAADPSSTLEAQIDRFLDPLVHTNNFYGAVFIARGNRVLLNKGYGLASIEHGVPNTADSVFQIASVSKPFTATAVLLLAQRGLVDLKAPLSKILPDYPNGDRLTLHHLLLHTSGIPDINVQPIYAQLSLQHQSPGSLVAAFKDLPLAFDPGARFSYSNSNYNVLAAVIERMTGRSYGHFLRDEFFIPLGMSHTAHRESAAAIIPHLVDGYAPTGRAALERAPWIDWSAKTGNGSLYSTGDDIWKWTRAFFGGRVLAPEMLKLALTPQLTNIGIDSARGDLGYVWSIARHLDRQKIWFLGRSPGYSAAISYYPVDDLTIAVFSNTYSLVTMPAADAFAAMVFGKPYDAPRITDAPVSRQLADRLVGTYKFGQAAPVPNMKVTVVARDGHLYLEPDFARMAPSALLSAGDLVFIVRSYWLELRFDAEPNANATALRLFGARAERMR